MAVIWSRVSWSRRARRVAVVFGAGVANADPYDNSRQSNDQAPHAANDQSQPAYGNGYNYGYDDGYARRDRNDRYRNDPYRHETRYERGAYYYGSDCDHGDNAAGTVLGAITGGLIGGAVSHGNGGAVVGARVAR